MTTVAAVALVALIAIVIAVRSGGSSKPTPGAAGSTTASFTGTTALPTTTTTLGSARGKPCVPVKGPLPAGAPAVPVQVGPPPTKLVVRDLRVGTGAVVQATSTLTVDYIGVACSTGVVFDSSYKSGQPATFPLSGVIKGWQQGIPGMRVGGERLLGIPSDLAYGPGGQGPIAPDEALWFVVDVKKVA